MKTLRILSLIVGLGQHLPGRFTCTLKALPSHDARPQRGCGRHGSGHFREVCGGGRTE